MVCTACKLTKSKADFSADKTKSSGFNSRCKDCQRQLVALHYLKNKEKYREARNRHKDKKRRICDSYKSKPCCDCDIQYPPWIMQFDHVRGKKEFTISQSRFDKTLLQLEEEIAKCEVVCANCHAHRTFLSLTKHEEFKHEDSILSTPEPNNSD
jgi:hypothetical protein